MTKRNFGVWTSARRVGTAGLTLLLATVFASAGDDRSEFIRPRQEGQFNARIGKPFQGHATVLGRMHGYEIAEIKGPGPLISMGKAIAADPSGFLWFVDSREDKAVRLNPKTLEMVEFGVPRGAAPYSVATDSKGIVWMTAHGIEMLLELRPQEGIVISHVPPTPGFLIHIRVDQKTDTVYFGQPGANRVVAFNTAKGFHEYPIPTANSGPGRIDIGADGSVWFPELYTSKLAHLTPETGKIDEWDLPVKDSLPAYCRVDSTGTVWISASMADRIHTFRDGKIDRTYMIPTRNSVVSTQVEDLEGGVWFTEGGWRGSSGGNKLGRLTPDTGQIEEFQMPRVNSQPLGLVRDAEGSLWFQESTIGAVVRVRKIAQAPERSRAQASGTKPVQAHRQ